MDVIIFLWLVILAHVLAEFVLQTDKVVQSKNRLEIKGFLKHGAVVFICTLMATHFYSFSIIFSLIATLVHIFLEYFRIHFNYNSIIALLADQFIHLCFLIILWNLFSINLDHKVLSFYSFFLSSDKLNIIKEYIKLIFPYNRTIIIIIVYFYVIFGGSAFIRAVLDCILPSKTCIKGSYTIEGKSIIFSKSGRDSNQVGKYIGIFERTIVLTLVLYGAWSAVGFVLAAKSIARFNELNNKEFAEYYLIGTLLSALIAVAGGLLLKSVLPVFSL